MKIIKNNIKLVIGLIIGVLISSGVVYALSISGSNVTFNKTGVTGATKDTVQEAVAELYGKANTLLANALPKMSDMCPGCKYIYTTLTFQYGSGATELDSRLQSQLKDNWEDVVTESGKKYFIGVKVNASNVVEKAYACGIQNGVPFCIEGRKEDDMTTDIYNANKALLQSASLFPNTSGSNYCTVRGSYMKCIGSVNAVTFSYGLANVGSVDNNDYCSVRDNGDAYC